MEEAYHAAKPILKLEDLDYKVYTCFSLKQFLLLDSKTALRAPPWRMLTSIDGARPCIPQDPIWKIVSQVA